MVSSIYSYWASQHPVVEHGIASQADGVVVRDRSGPGLEGAGRSLRCFGRHGAGAGGGACTLSHLGLAHRFRHRAQALEGRWGWRGMRTDG